MRRPTPESTRRPNGRSTTVVIGVHGWHHDAAPDDDFAVGFARTLRAIRRQLADGEGGAPGIHSRSRQLLTGSGDVNIFGICVGWRGASLPSAVNDVTLWDRKTAAERVGAGDFRELLLRLNALYRASLQDRGPSMPYLGMASIGHSFGAQVLFRAVSSTLEQELSRSPDGTSDSARS